MNTSMTMKLAGLVTAAAITASLAACGSNPSRATACSLPEGPNLERAISAARCNHGNLVTEIHKTFQDGRLSVHVRQSGVGLFDGHDPSLTFAVIAETARFEDGLGANFYQSFRKF